MILALHYVRNTFHAVYHPMLYNNALGMARPNEPVANVKMFVVYELLQCVITNNATFRNTECFKKNFTVWRVLRKRLYLMACKLFIIQDVVKWIVSMPFSINVFITSSQSNTWNTSVNPFLRNPI
jgi:hypothetical protein